MDTNLYENVKPENRAVARRVVERVCRKLDVEPDELTDESRRGLYAQARRIVAFLLRPEGLTWDEIGSIFGRNGTSAKYGVDTLEARMRLNNRLRVLVERLAAKEKRQEEPHA